MPRYEIISAAEQDERYLHLLPELMPLFEQSYEAMPFHNWQHAVGVAEGMIVEREYITNHGIIEPTGIFVDTTIGWGHDKDLTKYQRLVVQGKKPAATPERYAEKNTNALLLEARVDAYTRSQIRQGIRATELGSTCITLLQKKTRRKDLQNITGDYVEDFLDNMNKLRLEAKLVTGKDMSLTAYKDLSLKILSQYVSDDLSYGEFDRPDGRYSVFQLRAAANIQRLAQERASEVGLHVVSFARSLSEPVLKIIGIETDKAA